MTTPEPRFSLSPDPAATPADVRPHLRHALGSALARLVMLVMGSAGCSLIFVDGPPQQHRTLPYFDCTSSNIAPVADFIVAGTEGLVAASSVRDLGSASTGSGDSLL